MPRIQTIDASEFEATCLGFLDRLADHTLDQVVITQHGRVVALLPPPPDDAVAGYGMHGFLRGSVALPPGFDLTAPVVDADFGAARGSGPDHGRHHALTTPPQEVPT